MRLTSDRLGGLPFVAAFRRSLRQRIALACLVIGLVGAAPAPALAQGAPVPSQGPNFGTFSLGEVAISLAASGGAGPGSYTWQVVDPQNLPPGVSLRTDSASWPAFISANASATLLGVATTPGLYTFTLRVISGGVSTNQLATLRVTALTVTEPWNLPRMFVGKPFSHQLRSENGVGPVTWATPNSATLASRGLTLSPGGLLSGTPTSSGFFSITVRPTDSNGTPGRSINLEIFDIEITPRELPNALQGQSYNAVLTASGGTAPYVFTASSLPSGLVLDPFTGTISGTSTAGRGSWRFSVTVTDAAQRSAFKSMSITTIRPPQGPPRIEPYGPIWDDCTLGWPCEKGVSVFSGGTPPFTYEISGQPRGMVATVLVPDWINPPDFFIAGTPVELGEFDVQVTVTDAVGKSTTNTFPLRVSRLLQRFDSFRRLDFIEGTLDVPYSKRAALTGGALPYSVAHVAGELPPGLTFDPATFTVAGTPTVGGSFSPIFEYTDASGNRLRVTDWIYIDGTFGSSPNGTLDITSSYNLGTVTVGTSQTRTLFACCVPSYLWTAQEPLPPGLALSTDGVLSITAITPGLYTFKVRAADAMFPEANYAEQRFHLSVVDPPEFPIAITTLTLPYGNVGTAYNQVLAATGGAAALSWTLAENNFLPPGIGLANDGTLSGTPTATGQFGFSVSVTDGTSSVSRFFIVSVYANGEVPPLDLPVGPNLSFVVAQQTVSLAATGGVAPYQYSLTPNALPVPGMRVQSGPPLPNGATGTGSFLGVITQPGVYPTSIRVTDAAGNILDRALVVTVLPLQILSQNPLPRGAVGTPYSLMLPGYGGTGPYAWSATNLPSGLTLAPSGQISGTPTASATFLPRFTITDLATGVSATPTTFTLGVDPFAITTAGDLPPAVVGTFYSQALLAPGCVNCTWSIIGTLPAGLSLDGDAISGTPTGTTTGSQFTVRATGSNGIVSRTFRIQIASSTPQPLSIVTSSFADRTVGALTANSLTSQGGMLPHTWSVDSGELPPGISLAGPGELLGANQTPGVMYLTGRPMVAGQYAFTLKITDALGATTTRSFTWNISPLNFGYGSLPIIGTTLVLDTAYSQPLLGIGGSAPYTWVNNGPMPPGLTLDSGIVSGAPSNTGSFTVPMTLTDAGGEVFNGNVTFNIGSPTGTLVNFGTGPGLGVFQQGAFSRNLSLSGGTAPYSVTSLTPLPPGFALLGGDSLLSGSASGTWFLAGSPLATGTVSFTLRAEDSVGNVGVRTFTITIAPLALITTTGLGDASTGIPYSQPLAFFGADTVTWSVPSTSTMPPGLTVSPAGVISGTPTQTGTFSFVLTATDAAGTPVNFTFSLRISGIAIAGPAILPPVTAGVLYNHALTATGGASVLVWSATGLPFGLSMSPDGTISGSTTSTSGTFSVLVTATDGTQSMSRRFGLSIRTPNPLALSFATASTSLADAAVGQGFSVTLTPFGGVPPYTWSVAAGFNLPPGLALISGALLPPNLAPGSTLLAGQPTTPGVYQFDLIATDSAGTTMQRSFTLRVSSIVILNGAARSATLGVPYAQQFTAVGGTAPYTFSIGATAQGQDALPAGLQLSANGLISGTPTSTGIYTFRLRVQDVAGNTFSRLYSLTAANATGRFVSTTNVADTSLGTGRSQLLSVAGGSAANYSWTLSAGSLPPGMGLTSTGPNLTSLTGRPTAVGTYSYTLRATDVADGSNTVDRVFTLRVTPIQIVSPAIELGFSELPSGHVGAPYSTAVKAAGAHPPYTFSTSPFTPLPAGLTLSPAGVLAGTPQQSGQFTIIPVIADALGNEFAGTTLLLVVTASAATAPLLAGGAATVTLAGASIGLPYVEGVLNRLIRVRGGTAPFSWNADAGSILPPGLTLLPGGNGVSDVLAGVPTTAGAHLFSLRVHDSGGQTLVVPVSLTVTTLVVTPDAVPPGRVGTPYSVTFTASGGTAPRTIALAPASDLPPGLVFDSGGKLEGSPALAGNFIVGVTVIDSAGLVFTNIYPITIDNAAGEVPALNLAPESIQVLHVQGTSPPGPKNIAIETTSGTLPFGAVVSGIPGANLSQTAGTTSTSVNLTLDSSMAVGTYTGFVGAAAADSVNRIDLIPVTVTISPPPPCTHSLSRSTSIIQAAGGASSVNVTTGSHCTWTAVASDSWITFTSLPSGTGPALIRFRTAANPTPAQRDGTITVNGQVLALTQYGTECSFAITPSSLTTTAAGGPAEVTVSSSASTCAWTASGLSAAPGTGAGGGVKVTMTVPPNDQPASRVLNATIAGKTFTVNQSGIDCTFSLSPYDASFSASGGEGAVQVTTLAGCSYDTTLGPSWISVTSGAAGNGPAQLAFEVEPTSTTAPRSGSLTIGGQTFQVNQAGLTCNVMINTAGLGSPYGPSGVTGTIAITANNVGCGWSASSNAGWATLSPESGSGSGTVFVTIVSNASSTTSRDAQLTINGQIVSIQQLGTTCEYRLLSTDGSVPATGGAGAVGVVTPNVCGWSSTSDAPWLSITASGTAGSGDVQFVAQPNTEAIPRVGRLTIAGLTYTLAQSPAPCSYSLGLTNVSVASTGVSDSVSFTGAAGCAPSAVSYASWISVTTSYTGTSGTVNYSVAPSPFTTNRIGTIHVGDATFTITQIGAACGYRLNSYGALFSRSGGDGNVFGSPTALGCVPDTGTTQPSMITLGALIGPVSNIFTQGFTVTPFHSLTTGVRIGHVTFGGQIFTVKQSSW